MEKTSGDIELTTEQKITITKKFYSKSKEDVIAGGKRLDKLMEKHIAELNWDGWKSTEAILKFVRVLFKRRFVDKN